MEFINVEIVGIAQYDFKILDTVANEYYEDFPVIKYGFDRKDGLNYIFFVSFMVKQSKQNKSATIRVETTFSILTTEEIIIDLDEDTIRLMCDLFYIAWGHTIAILNIRCYESIFTDNYLSKRSIGDFYSFLQEKHNPKL